MQKKANSLFCLMLSVLLILLSASPMAQAANEYNYQVNTDPGTVLYVRQTPDTSKPSIGSLASGTKVYVSETTKDSTNRNWGKITYKDGPAWICIDYCKKIEVKPIVPPNIPNELKVNWTFIDVSQFQLPSEINWQKLKAAGVKGVIIRIGGTTVLSHESFEDSLFMEHYYNAAEAGMYIGAYFFSYAMNKEGAKKEAELAVNVLKRNNCVLTLPVFIDIEDYSYYENGRPKVDTQHKKIGKAACDEIVNTFCDTIQNAGYYPGIYCNLDYTRTTLSPSVFKDNRAVWIAQWLSSDQSPETTGCDYTGRFDMWQYTDSKRIDGFSKPLDASKCYVNLPKVIADSQSHSPNPPIPDDEPDSPVTPPIGESDLFGVHKPSEWRETKAPTCNTPGERIKTCTDCNITLVRERIQPSFGSHKRSVAYVCVVDNGNLKAGHVLTVTDKASLHDVNEKTGYADLTYNDVYETNGGVKITYCKSCNTVLTASYSYKSSCKHTSLKASKKPATCTAFGVETDTCTACNKTVSTRYISPVAHTLGLPKSNATCLSDGNKIYSCTSCKSEIRTEFDGEIAHDYSVIKDIEYPESVNGQICVNVKCKACNNTVSKKCYYGTLSESRIAPDVNDARSALRMSVMLLEPTPVQKVCVDLDMDNTVSVNDARLILRISVMLDNLETIYSQYKK